MRLMVCIDDPDVMSKIRMRKFTFVIIIIFILSSVAIAKENEKDSLIVYGDGFAFGIREPEGWKGDIQNANIFSANIIFYRKSEDFKTAKSLIRILVTKKVDENTKADLEHDIKAYKARYKDIQFKDISLAHPKYKTYSKLFFMPGKFYEYVVYINPGKGTANLFSASMNKQIKKATENEINDFKDIIGSIVLISDNLKVKKKQ